MANREINLFSKATFSRKEIVLLAILVFGIIGLAGSSRAKDWYVDKDATGANNGTSWVDAWTNFDQIAWPYYGTCPSQTAVCGGDNIYISGGTTSKTYVATSDNMFPMGGVSGTQGVDDNHRITVATGAKSAFPVGHDGLVIFDGDGKYTLLVNAGDYVTLDGEKNGAINWKIYNTSLFEKWFDTAVNAAGEKDIVRYLEVAKAGRGISLWNQRDGGEVAHCYLHDIRGDAAIGIDNNLNASSYDLAKIHHNIISLNGTPGAIGEGPDGIQLSGGVSIYNNVFTHEYGEVITGVWFSNGTFQPSIGQTLTVPSTGATGTITAISVSSGSWATHDAHGTFVMSSGTYSGWNPGGGAYVRGQQVATIDPSSQWTQHSDFLQAAGPYVKIYNNTFRNIGDSAMDLGTWQHRYIFNNVIYQDSDVPRALEAPGPTVIRDTWYPYAQSPDIHDDVHVYNNTIVDVVGAGVFEVGSDKNPTVNNFNIKNNIIINSGIPNYTYLIGVNMQGVDSSHVSIDRNLVNAGSHGINSIYYNGSLYTQAAGWLNSTSPLYTPFVRYSEQSKSNDFHLSANDSVARGQGFNFSSECTTIPELCYDKDGKPRPANGAWDLGAYQYAPGNETTPPDAPRGLTVN